MTLVYCNLMKGKQWDAQKFTFANLVELLLQNG